MHKASAQPGFGLSESFLTRSGLRSWTGEKGSRLDPKPNLPCILEVLEPGPTPVPSTQQQPDQVFKSTNLSVDMQANHTMSESAEENLSQRTLWYSAVNAYLGRLEIE